MRILLSTFAVHLSLVGSLCAQTLHVPKTAVERVG